MNFKRIGMIAMAFVVALAMFGIPTPAEAAKQQFDYTMGAKGSKFHIDIEKDSAKLMEQNMMKGKYQKWVKVTHGGWAWDKLDVKLYNKTTKKYEKVTNWMKVNDEYYFVIKSTNEYQFQLTETDGIRSKIRFTYGWKF